MGEERNSSSSDASSDSTLPEGGSDDSFSDGSSSDHKGIFQFDSSDNESFHSSADRFEDDDGSSFGRTFSDESRKSPVLWDVAGGEFAGKLDQELMENTQSHADV